MNLAEIEAAEKAIEQVLDEISASPDMRLDQALDRLSALIDEKTSAGSLVKHIVALNVTLNALALRDAIAHAAQCVDIPHISRPEPAPMASSPG